MENTKSSTIEGKNVGKKCRTHYRGTFNVEHSLIPLMTEESHWNLYVVQE